MTKEETKKIRLEEQEILKRERQLRIDKGLPAKELEDIKKNMPLHYVLYTLMKINNTFIEKMDKDYQKGLKKSLKEYIGRPIIFAPNHVRMQDIEVEMEANPIHQVLVSGDYINVHGTMAGNLLERNGIAYFDMRNIYDSEELKAIEEYINELKELIKILEEYSSNVSALTDELFLSEVKYNVTKSNLINDRKNVITIIEDILTSLYNVLWYYEGTWCVSPNKPYNDGSYQIVQTAIDTNAIVVPVSFDMIDHKKAVIRYGDPIDYRAIYGNRKLSHQEKINALDILKGQIGKGIIDIWEKYNFTYRNDLVKKYVPNLYDYPTPEEAFAFKKPPKYGVLHACWDEYLEKVLSEWEFTLEDLEEKRFKDKTKVEPEEAFNHLYEDIKPNMNNAFLFSKRNHH